MLFQNTAFAAQSAGGFASSMVIMLVFLAIMYFLLIRPQKKKEKETNEMRSALRAGDQITTIGGFVGTVVKVKEDSVILALGSDKMKVEVKKWAIGEVNKASTRPAPKAEETVEEEPKRKGPKMLKKKSEETAEKAEEVAAPVVEDAPEAVEPATEVVEEVVEEATEE